MAVGVGSQAGVGMNNDIALEEILQLVTNAFVENVREFRLWSWFWWECRCTAVCVYMYNYLYALVIAQIVFGPCVHLCQSHPNAQNNNIFLHFQLPASVRISARVPVPTTTRASAPVSIPSILMQLQKATQCSISYRDIRHNRAPFTHTHTSWMEYSKRLLSTVHTKKLL